MRFLLFFILHLSTLHCHSTNVFVFIFIVKKPHPDLLLQWKKDGWLNKFTSHSLYPTSHSLSIFFTLYCIVYVPSYSFIPFEFSRHKFIFIPTHTEKQIIDNTHTHKHTGLNVVLRCTSSSSTVLCWFNIRCNIFHCHSHISFYRQ